MNREDVLSKVRKLFALTESPNEHEAKRAMEKAQELCAQFNLSLTDIEKKALGVVAEQFSIGKTKSIQSWLKTMVASFGKFYACSWYISTERPSGLQKLYIVGRPDDVALFAEVLRFASDVFERLFKNAWGEFQKVNPMASGVPGYGRRYRADYLIGFVQGVTSALERNQESKSLVIVAPTQEIEQMWKEKNVQSTKRVVSFYGNHGAMGRGYNDGQAAFRRSQIGE